MRKPPKPKPLRFIFSTQNLKRFARDLTDATDKMMETERYLLTGLRKPLSKKLVLEEQNTIRLMGVKHMKVRRRFRAVLASTPPKQLDTKFENLACFISFLLPKWAREEWLGDFREDLAELARKPCSYWKFWMIALGKCLVMLFALARIRINDLVSPGKKKTTE